MVRIFSLLLDILSFKYSIYLCSIRISSSCLTPLVGQKLVLGIDYTLRAEGDVKNFYIQNCMYWVGGFYNRG